MHTAGGVVVLSELPGDQARLIVDRLGEARVASIAEEAKSVTSFYNLCIREMGHETGGNNYTKVPTKGQAYVEICQKKKEEEMPEFSHRYIKQAVMQFGGWKEMKFALKTAKSLEAARYKFHFAYEDVLAGL